MFEFIEHPLEPLRSLNAAVSKMRAGGLLAIVTPNGTAGEGWRNGQEGWIGFRADLEHMQYLHVEAVDYLAHSLGCRIVHLEQYGFRSPDNIAQGRKGSYHMTTGNPRLRGLLKDIPGVRQTVYAVRDLQGRLRAIGAPALDTGLYHLFVVLQKLG